ncbi:MAG: AAA family ATPase [Oscillospiraceae bacterium]|nr:AAA family ATPase [Oscillospiraceae bacterium]
MKILSMTATFGKLDGETLELKPDLNIHAAPNEWGKSTWCAFLTVMLYGIDTRERTTKEQLADKERYLPWTGKPMSGTMRILWKERDITIQRRARGRVPMGDFMAWETQTGVTVRELTAENCGAQLLGVEKSVFLRTGFLRFSDLPVRQDEELRRRLNNLVTTGDETGDGELLGAKLVELRNRCRYNQTGLIPQCRTELRQIQEQLWECQRLHSQHDSLSEQVRGLEQELHALQNHRDWLDYADAEAHRESIGNAEGASRAADRLVIALQEKYAKIPEKRELEEKLEMDRERLEYLRLDLEEKPGSSLPIILTALLAAVLLIGAVLLADRGLLLPCVVLGIVSLIVCGALAGRRRQDRIWYNIEQTRRQNKTEELEKSIAARESQLSTYADLQAAMDNAEAARMHLKALKSMEKVVQPPEEPDEMTMTREETLHSIGDLTGRLARLRLQLGQCRGRMEHLPEPELLQRRLSQTRRRMSELELTRQAIDCALDALETAKMELQRRFAPRISQRAGYFLSRLTGGVYDRIQIGDDLSVQAAGRDETTLRSPQWRSEGTGDQMYLALRLAVWEVLAPDCPIVLDDALIRFDQKRMERAMDLLKELSEKRQILLFSCQEREKEYWNRM